MFGETICEKDLLLGKYSGQSHAIELVFVDFRNVVLSLKAFMWDQVCLCDWQINKSEYYQSHYSSTSFAIRPSFTSYNWEKIKAY